MKLYDYYRSSACYRVRIALNLKNISYEKLVVHLVNNGGEQHHEAYTRLNPQGLVPTLDENGHIIRQSLAIIEYLDEISPTPPLLPEKPYARAKVRSLALLIACDMHPLNNLRVLNQLRTQFHADEGAITTWMHEWFQAGFSAFEKTLSEMPEHKSSFCFGNEPSVADICLIPQVFSAQRFGFDLSTFPLINAVNAHCVNLSAFRMAAPENG